MGAWGEGVFENDEALDLVGYVLKPVLEEINGFYKGLKNSSVGIEDIDCVLACIAIHTSMVNNCYAIPPITEYVNTIFDGMLKIYDSEIDELSPDPEYKILRRECIIETFKKYQSIAKKES